MIRIHVRTQDAADVCEFCERERADQRHIKCFAKLVKSPDPDQSRSDCRMSQCKTSGRRCRASCCMRVLLNCFSCGSHLILPVTQVLFRRLTCKKTRRKCTPCNHPDT